MAAIRGRRLGRNRGKGHEIEPRSIETGTVVVDGVATFRRLPGERPPAVLVHGNPTHSEDWAPILERMGGPALALDLPGWGRSARPDPGRFDYSMHGLACFFSRFLERMEIGEYSLAVHDWGGLALIAAQAEPERVRRLVVINALPLLPGYRWHRTARIWRTPRLAEFANRLWSRRLARSWRRPEGISDRSPPRPWSSGDRRTATSPPASGGCSPRRSRTASWSSWRTPATGPGGSGRR